MDSGNDVLAIGPLRGSLEGFVDEGRGWKLGDAGRINDRRNRGEGWLVEPGTEPRVLGEHGAGHTQQAHNDLNAPVHFCSWTTIAEFATPKSLSTTRGAV